MAELLNKSQPGRRRGRPQRGRGAPRMDMTALVDVAFLMLTFFILTTTMASQRIGAFVVPPKTEEKGPDLAYSDMMTIVLDKEGIVHYFYGIGDEGVEIDVVGAPSLREEIKDHFFGKDLPPCKGEKTKACRQPFVVVKSLPGSKYGDLIELWDDLRIVEANRYTLTDLNHTDSLLLSIR